MEPHALLLDGRVKFYNFTHYDTEDLVRVLEAPYRARLAGNIGEPGWKPSVDDVHIRYYDKRARRKFARAGRYIYDGLRIAKPQHLHDNPIESLCVDLKELPLPIVEDMLRFAGERLAPYPRWDPQARTRQDVNYLAAAPMLRVRIHSKVQNPLPKGYLSPTFAEHAAHMKARRVMRRTGDAALRLTKAKRALKLASKFMGAMGCNVDAIPALNFRLERLQREADELHSDLVSFFHQEVIK